MTQIQAQSENPGLTPTKDIATQLRVLVVDDSKLQRRIVSLSLKKWGFQVTKAAGGEEALEILGRLGVVELENLGLGQTEEYAD